MVRYQHVDTLSLDPVPPSPAPSALAPVVAALDDSTLEPDVRYLASDELAGRKRGTEGNRLGRQYIIGRLRGAGLQPLFGDSFEQATKPDGEPFAVNVGAVWPAADPDAEWVVLVGHHDHLGIKGGRAHPGADDNASAVALLLAVGDALGRAGPKLRRHVVLLFPDAEEPPYFKTRRMGSSWFWKHPPFPLERLRLALVLDLMGGRATPGQVEVGVGRALYVLGAEADPSLARLVRATESEPDAPTLLMSLGMIEGMPYVAWRRFPRSDYHGLREISERPFLFLTAGRTPRYHTPEDTPDSLDYERMGCSLRFLARITVRAAEGEEELRFTDYCADPLADARLLLRFLDTIDPEEHPSSVARRLRSDRVFAEELIARAAEGHAVRHSDYRRIQLASLRYQAVVWSPSRWWWSLW